MKISKNLKHKKRKKQNVNNHFNSFLRSTGVEDDTLMSDKPKARHNTIQSFIDSNKNDIGAVNSDRFYTVKNPSKIKIPENQKAGNKKSSLKRKSGNKTATASVTDVFGRHKDIKSFEFNHLNNLMTKTNNATFKPDNSAFQSGSSIRNAKHVRSLSPRSFNAFASQSHVPSPYIKKKESPRKKKVKKQTGTPGSSNIRKSIKTTRQKLAQEFKGLSFKKARGPEKSSIFNPKKAKVNTTVVSSRKKRINDSNFDSDCGSNYGSMAERRRSAAEVTKTYFYNF